MIRMSGAGSHGPREAGAGSNWVRAYEQGSRRCAAAKRSYGSDAQETHLPGTCSPFNISLSYVCSGVFARAYSSQLNWF